MLCIENGKEEEKNAVESSSQDNQLFPTLEGQDTKVSTLKHRAPSPDGSPEAKKARMGSIKQLSSTACPQSVAERLKESTLKNGSTVSVAEVKSPPVFTGQKDLSEEQLNQVRVIAQHLKDLGLRDAVNALVEETGCKIEHTYASQIRKSVKSGKWNEALTLLDKSAPFISKDAFENTRAELLLNKIISLASSDDMIKVIQILRDELPRYRANREFQDLSKLAFFSPERLAALPIIEAYRSPGYSEKVAKTIEKLLPSSFMLPENRLDGLFDDALKHQLNNCPYHMLRKSNTKEAAESIVRDHICIRGEMEIHDEQRILCHEVHCSAFSPNGKYFLTAATTRRVNLYKCIKKTGTIKHLKNLKPKATTHRAAKVSDIAWSHDSRFIAVAGLIDPVQAIKVIIYDLVSQKVHTTIRRTTPIEFTLICFIWDTYHLAVGDENGRLEIFDVSQPQSKDPVELCRWEGIRIRKIRALRDGGILALDTHNRIRRYYEPPAKHDETLIREHFPVCNFIVHKSDRLLITLTEKNFHLWDIEESSLVRTYRTFPHRDIILDAAFGGPNDEYFCAGSPEGKLIVYNINDTEPIFEVKGHYHHVNTVSWHPKSGLLATCGHDSVLRVWHLGCELENCKADVVTVPPPKSEKTQKKLKRRAKKKVKKELKDKEKERKKREKEAEEAAEEKRKYDEANKLFEATNSISAQLPPLGRIDYGQLMPLPPREEKIVYEKVKKPRKKRKNTEELMDVGTAYRMSYEITSDAFREQAPLLDLQALFQIEPVQTKKKKDRKRKRKGSSKKHQDGSMSMEIDDSSNGKAGPSGSENGSTRSNL